MKITVKLSAVEAADIMMRVQNCCGYCVQGASVVVFPSRCPGGWHSITLTKED